MFNFNINITFIDVYVKKKYLFDYDMRGIFFISEATN